MITFLANKNAKLSKIVLKDYPEISYSLLMKLLRNKDIKVNDKNIAVFSTVLEGEYYGLNKEYDYMISEVNQNLINAFYSPNKMVSYHKTPLFIDGESEGSAIFNIN